MSDHPQFSKIFKKMTLSTVGNGLKSGFIKKKGVDYHTWKKRWFILTEKYLFYFAKNSPDAQPKGVIELDKNSVITSVPDKRIIYAIETVYRKQIVQFDSKEEAKDWIEAIKKVIESQNPKQKEELTSKEKQLRENIKSIIPFSTIECKMKKYNSPWTEDSIINFFEEIGETNKHLYLYTILSIIFKDWEPNRIADFLWNTYGNNDLRNLSKYFCGKQSENRIHQYEDGSIVKENEYIFTFGRDTKGIKVLANIYNHIIKQYNITWSLATKCILSSIETWELKTTSDFFHSFSIELLKEWKVQQASAYLYFVIEYSEKHSEQPWNELDRTTTLFFHDLIKSWNNQQRMTLMTIAQCVWEWDESVCQKLSSILFDVDYDSRISTTRQQKVKSIYY